MPALAFCLVFSLTRVARWACCCLGLAAPVVDLWRTSGIVIRKVVESKNCVLLCEVKYWYKSVRVDLVLGLGQQTKSQVATVL
jgi:hypothetical protein